MTTGASPTSAREARPGPDVQSADRAKPLAPRATAAHTPTATAEVRVPTTLADANTLAKIVKNGAGVAFVEGPLTSK